MVGLFFRHQETVMFLDKYLDLDIGDIPKHFKRYDWEMGNTTPRRLYD